MLSLPADPSVTAGVNSLGQLDDPQAVSLPADEASARQEAVRNIDILQPRYLVGDIGGGF